MHEKSFKRCKLDSDLSVLWRNVMPLLTAFFSRTVNKFWARNRSDESLLGIRLWTTTLHFGLQIKYSKLM